MTRSKKKKNTKRTRSTKNTKSTRNTKSTKKAKNTKSVKKNVGKNTKKNVGKDTKKDVKKDVEKDVGKDVKKNVKKDIGKDVKKNVKKNKVKKNKENELKKAEKYFKSKMTGFEVTLSRSSRSSKDIKMVIKDHSSDYEDTIDLPMRSKSFSKVKDIDLDTLIEKIRESVVHHYQAKTIAALSSVKKYKRLIIKLLSSDLQKWKLGK